MYVCLYSVSVYVIGFVCKFVWLTLCKYLNVYEKRMFVIKYAWLFFGSMQLYMFGGVYLFEFSCNRLFYFI